jgi:hypothetical protein
MAKDTKHKERLQEIADTKFGELSDDQVLRILAERKQLEELEEEYLTLQKEQMRLSEIETGKTVLEQKLSELNKLISPDKPDEELLKLITERKEIEAKLDSINAEIASIKKEKPPESVVPKEEPRREKEVKSQPDVITEENKENVVEEKIQSPAEPEKESAVAEPEVPAEKVTATPPVVTPVMEGLSETDEFGREGIVSHDLPETSDLRRYIDQMKNNPSSLGTILDDLSATAKKNKAFMLEVAKIDPAYAMHYADSATLKKDEDFNVRVASMKNERNSGNALAEMLPEGRTSKVILAGVKQDYKNLRFVLPNMADYDKIVEIAKKGALETVKKLKDGVDVTLLIPKLLQKDKSFMEQVEKMTGKTKE